MKKYLLFLSLFLCISYSYPQDNYSQAIFCGTCQSVFSKIREKVRNDSIAIVILKENYNLSSDKEILEKSPNDIINFFNSENGKDIRCTHKKIVNINSKALLNQ